MYIVELHRHCVICSKHFYCESIFSLNVCVCVHVCVYLFMHIYIIDVVNMLLRPMLLEVLLVSVLAETPAAIINGTVLPRFLSLRVLSKPTHPPRFA